MRSSYGEASSYTPELTKLPGVAISETGARLEIPGGVESIERAAVTFPWGGINYGHFVLDCLSGISLLQPIPEVAEYGFVFPPLRAWQ